MNKAWNLIGGSLLVTFFLAGCATVDPTTPTEEFYKGKTIRFIVGYSRGGGYDTYTRAFARHITRFIPGNPTPIAQNMTGYGSLDATNYIYNQAKPDGLTIGAWGEYLILQQALGGIKVRFKAEEFGWVGAPLKGFHTCAIMGFTGLKTLNDVMKSGKVLRMGSTRAGSTTHDLPIILNKVMGTNFKVISGYRGTRKIRIALQKRDVDGVCLPWVSMRILLRSVLDAKGDDKLIPFITQGNSQDPEVNYLPQIMSVIKGEGNLSTFRLWIAPYEFHRALSLPPETPTDRLNTLRKAFEATMKDRAFLAEAKKFKLIISYVSGPEIEKYVHQILTAPPKAKENLQVLWRRKR